MSNAMVSVAVVEASQVAEARRAAAGLAQRNGFDEEAAGRVALVATELATNLVKHGGGGHLLVGAADDGAGGTDVKLVSIDRGPGMADVAGSLRDGVSTSGTAGNGLGAVVRQSHGCEIYSRPGVGTAILARLKATRPSSLHVGLDDAFGFVCVPHPSEQVSGDDCALRVDGDDTVMMVVDGLGHGPQAADAAAHAMRLFDRHWTSAPAAILEALHAGLRATRGAAVAVARIEPARGRVRYAGVGNIVGAVVTPGQAKRMLSHNGTVGHVARKFQEIDYPIADATAIVVMHSDGLGTSWSLDDYPGLLLAHPTLIAAVLFRDFGRGRDDATALVARAGRA